MWQRVRESYKAPATYNHTRDELRSFFGTLPLVTPGLVLARAWRGGMAVVPDVPPGPAYVLAAVGVKPSSPTPILVSLPFSTEIAITCEIFFRRN
jgi:hypothetical protein